MAEAPTMPHVDPPARAADRMPPGYELLGEVGRGGMGIVYKARHLALNRVVALKMILSGAHAADYEVARLRTEAEAIARLTHPGIVAVHEIGTHDGRPFLALEFCPGGSLEGRLAAGPMPPSEAAVLVRKLADAVQAAHEANVIHRDLKPANVLLSADGTPKITDFGLARKLDEQSQTQSGAVLGTPSYMAPEQALGAKDVGPAADVYALGAILYELLTGRPPFLAATPLDTMAQVINEDAVPLRRLNPQVPLDLETVSLKCLEKRPERRYGGPRDLADDLGRYLNGEPTRARPVGPLTRARKWVGRNPVVAGLSGLLVVALSAGTVVSLLFARNARHNQLETARMLDQVERTLARSLLRPLALDGRSRDPSAPEWEAMGELAASRPGRLGYRFVEEAVRGAFTSRQLADRAGPALHAAVGLERATRDQVEGLLLSRLDAGGLSDGHRFDLAIALAHLGGLSRPGSLRAGRLLARAVGAGGPQRYGAASGLRALAAAMGPDEAAEAADALCQVLVNELVKMDFDPRLLNGERPLASALVAVCGRLRPADRTRVVSTLLQGVTRVSPRPRSVRLLSGTIEALPSGPEPGEAYRIGEAIVGAMGTSSEMDDLAGFAEVLHLLARWQPPEGRARLAARAAEALRRAVGRADRRDDLPGLAEALARVARWADRESRAGAVSVAVAKLTDAMSDPADVPGEARRIRLVNGLASLGEWMGPADASKAANAMLGVLKQSHRGRDIGTAYLVGTSLPAIVRRMPAGEAGATAAAAAVLLRPALQAARGSGLLRPLTLVYVRLASVIHPEAADRARAEAVATLTAVLADNEDGTDFESAAWGLASDLAPGMSPADVTALAASLTAALKGRRNPPQVRVAAETLAVVCGHLGVEPARRAAGAGLHALMGAIRATEDRAVVNEMARGIPRLLQYLEAPDAADIAAEVASLLLEPYPDLYGKTEDGAVVVALEDPEPVNADLSVLLAEITSASKHRLALTAAAAVAGPTAMRLAVLSACEPLPCRLPTRQLVELLKMPACVGHPRRVVLDHLGTRFGRPFADHWDFVRFAVEQRLDLDLRGPPRRPGSEAAKP